MIKVLSLISKAIKFILNKVVINVSQKVVND